MNIFDTFPELQTERLVLRQVTYQDVPDASAFYMDDEITRWHGQAGLQSLEDVQERIRGWFIAPYAEKRGIRFGIALKENNRLIGSCGFWRWEKENFLAEIGYELARDYHWQGLMTEALGALIHFGFHQMELNRIEARTDHLNVASQKTLLSLGFHLDGVLREAIYENDQFLDFHIFSLLRKEYLSRNGSNS